MVSVATTVFNQSILSSDGGKGGVLDVVSRLTSGFGSRKQTARAGPARPSDLDLAHGNIDEDFHESEIHSVNLPYLSPLAMSRLDRTAWRTTHRRPRSDGIPRNGKNPRPALGDGDGPNHITPSFCRPSTHR